MNDLRKLAEDAARYISGPWKAGTKQDVHETWPVYATELDDIPYAVPLSAATDGLAELYAAASPDVILGLLDRIAELEKALYHVGYSPETDLSVYAKDAEAIARAALENSDLARSSSKVETGVAAQ